MRGIPFKLGFNRNKKLKLPEQGKLYITSTGALVMPVKSKRPIYVDERYARSPYETGSYAHEPTHYAVVLSEYDGSTAGELFKYTSGRDWTEVEFGEAVLLK
ncbi:hypothetical protein LCGC14_0895100 [marine sediment metagenome]|uniref:Uncharacterized protein n=1 Tax=marine sediment metagenome TaxID=412755 RepID=A0A0F9NY72_9ZZZZ